MRNRPSHSACRTIKGKCWKGKEMFFKALHAYQVVVLNHLLYNLSFQWDVKTLAKVFHHWNRKDHVSVPALILVFCFKLLSSLLLAFAVSFFLAFFLYRVGKLPGFSTVLYSMFPNYIWLVGPLPCFYILGNLHRSNYVEILLSIERVPENEKRPHSLPWNSVYWIDPIMRLLTRSLVFLLVCHFLKIPSIYYLEFSVGLYFFERIMDLIWILLFSQWPNLFLSRGIFWIPLIIPMALALCFFAKTIPSLDILLLFTRPFFSLTLLPGLGSMAWIWKNQQERPIFKDMEE